LPGASLNDILPDWKLTHIFEKIIPALKVKGLTDEDIDAILIDNPRRFFATV